MNQNTRNPHPVRSRTLTATGYLLGLAFFGAQPALAQLYTPEGTFESPTWSTSNTLTGTAKNGWTGNHTGTGIFATVSSTTAAPGGTQSLFLRDNSGSATAVVTRDWGTNITDGSFAFSFRNASAAGNSGTVGNFAVNFLSTGGATRNFALTWSDTAGFNLVNASGTSLQSISYAAMGYTPGNWNTLTVNFSETNNTASVLLNGIMVSDLTIASGQDAVLWQAGKVQITAGFSSGFASGYFDNLTASAIPEPSTYAALMAASVLGLAVSRRRR